MLSGNELVNTLFVGRDYEIQVSEIAGLHSGAQTLNHRKCSLPLLPVLLLSIFPFGLESLTTSFIFIMLHL